MGGVVKKKLLGRSGCGRVKDANTANVTFKVLQNITIATFANFILNVLWYMLSYLF